MVEERFNHSLFGDEYPALLIGCPVQRREWIIEQWWDAAVVAARKTGLSFGFIFVIDPTDPTCDIICSLSERDKISLFLVEIDEEERDDKRNWSEDRLRKMVFLRNLLLKWVRKIGPGYFLSLDSDMLLHKDGIMVLLDRIEEFDAVGGKAFLSVSGTSNPTFGSWRGDPENGRFSRSNRDYFCKVDILMAIKLMNPSAYSIDYEFARQGEDIGWSKNCWREGLSFGWSGEVTNRHVMNDGMLGRKDVRIRD